ncbi:MAG TPA: MFS transporter [Phycisphaerales bacterium]|nr:MFS transporter [Phycisphaerales bacterium]
MRHNSYRSTPVDTDRMPPGIGNILVNEAAERFAFYGFRAILVVYMTRYLLDRSGAVAPMNEESAKAWSHWFLSATYALPVVGALLSDIWLGKYRTIIGFSLLYCLGLFAVVVDRTQMGLLAALGLVAVGSGIIKPCVSANVGDQFGSSNRHLLAPIYNWFYFAINLGAFVSMLLTPWLLDWGVRRYGIPGAGRLAFGVCAALMVVATAAFWMGRWKFVHVPAGGWSFVRDTLSKEGLWVLAKLSVVYLFVFPFWALFDQTTAAWVLQAEKMNLQWLPDGLVQRLPGSMQSWGTVLPAQLTSVNSILILLMIPLFNYLIYPAVNRVWRLTPLRKIGAGLFVAAGSFVICAFVEKQIGAGAQPNVWWQVLAYVIITAAEILVSITALEFSYAQAPKRMKSFVMAIFLLSISLGNAFAAAVNEWIRPADGPPRLQGAAYYWFFVWFMLVTAVLFVPVAMAYRGKTYTQDEMNTG